MTLLLARHRNPESAALTIAANRASKCGLLRGDGIDRIADRYAADLETDVADWIKRTAAGRRSSAQTRSLLHQSIMRAYGVPNEWVDYAMQYGAAEAIERARASGGYGYVKPCTACGSAVAENGHCVCCGRESGT